MARMLFWHTTSLKFCYLFWVPYLNFRVYYYISPKKFGLQSVDRLFHLAAFESMTSIENKSAAFQT